MHSRRPWQRTCQPLHAPSRNRFHWLLGRWPRLARLLVEDAAARCTADAVLTARSAAAPPARLPARHAKRGVLLPPPPTPPMLSRPSLAAEPLGEAGQAARDGRRQRGGRGLVCPLPAAADAPQVGVLLAAAPVAAAAAAAAVGMRRGAGGAGVLPGRWQPLRWQSLESSGGCVV